MVWRDGRDDLWPGRNGLLAREIRPGWRVLDVGAGSEGLRGLLPAGCEYVPVDRVAHSADTVVRDLNVNCRLPRGFDVVVLSGVLEYLDRPAAVLREASRAGRVVLLSYAHNPKAVKGRRNSLTREQLRSLAKRLGLRIRRVGVWRTELTCPQMLYRLAR